MDPFALIGGLLGKVGGAIGDTIGQFNPSQTQNMNSFDKQRKMSDPQSMKLSIIHNPGLIAQATGQSQASPPPPSLTNQITQQGLGRNPELPKKPMSQAVKNAIETASKEFGVLPSLLYDIGFSEGGFRPDARNETPEGRKVGIPVGLFQFTPGTWNHDLVNYAKQPGSALQGWLDKNGNAPPREDPLANARAAAYLIKFGQAGRWDASKPNWGRFYNDSELQPYYAQTPGYQ